MLIKKICCIGTDYMGGPLCSIIALNCPEIKVFVVDDNVERVMQWNSDQLPVFEPGLDEIVKKCRGKNLFFTSDKIKSIKEADIIFICAKPPLKNNSEKVNDSNVIEDIARIIAETADSHKIIVEKTAMVLRATEMIQNVLKANQKPGIDFQILSNPEFFCDHDVIQKLLNPDTVLIGAEKSAKGAAAVESLIFVYEHWVPRNKILTTDPLTAEICKIATSAISAQKISSINSLSEVCELTDGEILDVASIIGMDSRIGSKLLEPSLGFGGLVLYQDLQNLVYLCKSVKLPLVAEYWNKVLKMNDYQKKRFTKKIIQSYFNTLTDKKIGIFGFSYRKKTNETAYSPAILLCSELLDEGSNLVIFDPVGKKREIMETLSTTLQKIKSQNLEDAISVCEDPYEAAQGANGIVFCTDWDIFKNLDYTRIYNEMLKPAHIFDGFFFLPHKELLQIGFQVHVLGKTLT